MPCDCSHMEANAREIELSKIACLLDELHGKPFDKDDWCGYHPRVYTQAADGDALISELCDKLQTTNVTEYSLEMQMWWRDHQEADKQRLSKDQQKLKTEADKRNALKKLTKYERGLLGL